MPKPRLRNMDDDLLIHKYNQYNDGLKKIIQEMQKRGIWKKWISQGQVETRHLEPHNMRKQEKTVESTNSRS